MQLYLNNSSIKNNKYFKTHEELLSLSNKELTEIKAYKKRTGFLTNRGFSIELFGQACKERYHSLNCLLWFSNRGFFGGVRRGP